MIRLINAKSKLIAMFFPQAISVGVFKSFMIGINRVAF